MERQVEWNLGNLLSVSSAYWKSCTVHAAVRLEIFTVLGQGRVTIAEIGGRINGNLRGVAPLLNALVAMGLLHKDAEQRYENTPFSRKFLDKSSPAYSGHIILHHHHLVDGWAQLDQAVREGRPVDMRSYGDEAERESFLMGMFNLAMANAPRVAKEIDLAGRRRLLDLGGGPGTYAIHFCLANPDLSATIFDRPTTRDFALQTARRFGVEDRIDFVAGDFNGDPIQGPFDVAWLSQILHSNGPRECELLIAKTVSALEPGGLILIHEFFLNDTMDGPLFPALFSLNMLINNERGRSYSDTEIRGMLALAGINDIRRLPFQGPNDSYILRGIVP